MVDIDQSSISESTGFAIMVNMINSEAVDDKYHHHSDEDQEKTFVQYHKNNNNNIFKENHLEDLSHISHRQKKMPVRSPDSHRPSTPPTECAGCGGRILDRYYLMAVDRQWHLQCLTCSDCQVRLESEHTCFHRDGNIYCKEDYYRRFGSRCCQRCSNPIGTNELVMRARDCIYHVHCFTCAHCNKTLATGDYFGIKDTIIFCRSHYELMMAEEYMPSLSPTIPGGHPGAQLPPGGPQMAYYNGVTSVHKGRPRKRKSQTPDPDCMGIGINENGDPMGIDYMSHAARQKRMRTSFKHHQLRTMKSYFALNHNPDAKDLKQLAQKTGLTKRVLQVWFQNARAKYRRNVLRQESQGGDKKATDSISDTASLADISDPRSPALSDISSSPSLSDLQNSSIDQDQSSTGSLSELFTTSSMNEVN